MNKLYQFINKNLRKKSIEEHVFSQIKHETQHLTMEAKTLRSIL
jgi:hypothetical protein